VTASQVVTALLESLDVLDQSLDPHGLYACHDLDPAGSARTLHREWATALQPALVQLGARDFFASAPFDQATFTLSPLGQCQVTLRRLAKIRVRRFGSAYRVDDRVEYPERWRRADIPALLNDLRHPKPQARNGLHVLVLVGFTREAQPFEKELESMESAMRGLEFQTRTWLDRYGRAFSVGLMAWWRASGPFAA